MARLGKLLKLSLAAVMLTVLTTSSTVFAAPAVPPVSQLGDDATCQAKLVANAKNYDGDDLRAYLSKRLNTRDPTLSKTVNGPKGLLPVAQKNYDAYAVKAQTISNRIDLINSIRDKSLNGLTSNPVYDFSIANVPPRQADLTNINQYNANAQPIIELAKQRLAASDSTRYALTRSICASIYGAQVFNLVLPEARKQYIQTRIDGLQLNNGINQALYNSTKSVYEAKKAANVEYDMEGAIAGQVSAMSDPSALTAQLSAKTQLILNGSPSSWHTKPQSDALTEISRQINAQKDALVPVFNKTMTTKLPKVKKTTAPKPTTTQPKSTGGASPKSTAPKPTTQPKSTNGSGGAKAPSSTNKSTTPTAVPDDQLQTTGTQDPSLNQPPSTDPTTASKKHTPSKKLHSKNGWAGFIVNRNIKYDKIRGHVTVPQGTCDGKKNKATGIWLGLDGAGTTVEQTGISMLCYKGSKKVYYTAWWEMFPEPPHYFSGSPKKDALKMKPGDDVEMAVDYSQGKYTFTVRNHTSGLHVTHSDTCPKNVTCKRLGAEWIVEVPGNGNGGKMTPVPWSGDMTMFDLKVAKDNGPLSVFYRFPYIAVDATTTGDANGHTIISANYQNQTLKLRYNGYK